jgi:hypothetical protein
MIEDEGSSDDFQSSVVAADRRRKVCIDVDPMNLHAYLIMTIY